MDIGDEAEFQYEFTMIPVSAGVLFGLAVGIPVGIKMAIVCLGEGAS